MDENKIENVTIFDKIKKYKKIYLWVLLGIFTFSLILIIISIISIGADNKNNNTNNNSTYGQQNTYGYGVEDNLVQRKIDGVKVKKGEENVYPYSVIIENSVDARPLSGINEANIIYEVQAESSITRFLCIYATNDKIEKIGPVRSARPYYAEIADEYSPLFVHFGGSPEALDKIKRGFYNITSLNGIIYDGIYLFRDTSKQAPHNAYISSDLIQKYLQNNNIKENNGFYSSWIFNDTLKEYKDAKKINTINVIYGTENTLYNLKWVYNEQDKNYTRYTRDDKEYLDDKGNNVKTNNIILQFAQVDITDEVGRRKINLTEGGKAIMIRDGERIEGYWRKNNLLNRTKFFTYDKDGNEVEYELKPGKTWIHVIPKENYQKNIE